MDESPVLYINDKRVSKASSLYCRLVGNWSKGAVKKFRRELITLPISDWRHPIGSDWYVIDYRGDHIKLNRKRVGGKRNFRLTINDVAIQGDWKPLCDHLVAKVTGSDHHSVVDKAIELQRHHGPL